MSIETFSFAFEPAYRIAAFAFGVTPDTAAVVVDDEALTARFGLWRLRTELANIDHVETTGPFSRIRTIGPAHLSFADRGLTMATNSRRGVCLIFGRPVPGIEPTGRLRHPGLTVTVADCPGLIEAIERRRA
jgi:hypothetical protein